MDTDLRRVTIEGGTKRVALTLPATAPIAELMPAVARLCGMTGENGGPAPDRSGHEGRPPAWSLARAGQALALTSSLADARVADADVLHLVDTAEWRAPDEQDMSAIVREALEGGGGPWKPEMTAGVLAVGAVAAVLVAAAVAARTGDLAGRAGLLALLLAAGLLAGAVALPEWRTPAVPRAMTAQAWALAALGGWAVAGGRWDAAGLVSASVALGAATLASYAVVPEIAPGTTLGAAALAACAAAVANGAPLAAAAAVLAAAGVGALRLLPQLVSSLLAVVTTSAETSADQFPVLIKAGRNLVASFSAGIAVVVLGASLALFAVGDLAAVGVGILAATSLLLRSRPYRFLPEVLPLATSGGLALAGLTVAAVIRGWLPSGQPLGAAAVLAGLGLLGAGLAALWMELPPAPEPPRWVWPAVDLTLAPVAVAAIATAVIAH